MKQALRSFVKLPTQWIERGELQAFTWAASGSDNLAALMLLTVIAHHTEDTTGIAQLTYSELADRAWLSRAKVAAGLPILYERKLITRDAEGRSTFGLCNYQSERGYAFFPAAGLYTRGGVVGIFKMWHLRQRAELDALKLYFLFASRRDRRTNMARLSYDAISRYSGISRNFIRAGLSTLSAGGLIHIEHPFDSSEMEANGYRLTHLQTRQHMGTSGRSDEAPYMPGYE